MRLWLIVGGIALGFSGIAQAADLASKGYMKPTFAQLASNWSGFYAGLHAGYGWGDAPTTVTPDAVEELAGAGPPFQQIPDTSSISGGVGGGQVGYNWQQAALLLGLETDISYAGWRSSGSAAGAAFAGGINNTEITTKFEWFGTLRGRVGWLATPNVLVFGTGGLAYGRVATTVVGSNLANPALNCNGLVYCFAGTAGGMSVGWTAGAGIEYMIDPSWSVKAEYLHIDLGSRSMALLDQVQVPLGGFEFVNNSFKADTVQVGVNYHFH